MFSCRSCMQRHIQGLLENLTPYRFGQKSVQYGKSFTRGRVGYSSAPAIVHQDKAEHNDLRVWRPQHGFKSLNSDLKDGTKVIGRKEWLQSRGTRPSSKPAKELPSKAAIRKELTFLGDPLKLATHVVNLLRKDKFDEAENIVRNGSKHIQCTVSWNHLVDWQLSKGRVNSAIKTYNEMKKRGQAPDAHTYTILFRGLANFSHYPQALSKALSIYHSMDAENSSVRPNTIHTNAVLQVCARAEDMDALFGVAAKLQRKGLRAANNLTFTIVLNAIRQHTVREPSGRADESERSSIKQKAIFDARRMWDDIISRWRQGDIWIDEELACSMGRVLLLGSTEDIDDIFSLVEQTMNVPRLVPRFGTKTRDKMDPNLQGNRKLIISESIQSDSSAAPDNSSKDLVEHGQFKAIKPPAAPNGVSVYAKPGNNSLSLVLQALQDLRIKRPVAEYWDLFTSTHKVKPDSQNYHSYLRILRLFRASSETVELLLKMPTPMLEKKTFRIAMSTCARDKNNQSAFGNAGKILDLMQETLSDLDLPALHSYMEVAIYGRMYRGEGNGNEEHIRGRQIQRALQRLGPAFINIKSALAYGERPIGKAAEAEAKVYRDAALALTREMISAYDKLMNKGMVPPEMHKDLTAERSKLAAFVTRFHKAQIAKEATKAAKLTKDGEVSKEVLETQEMKA